MQGGNPDITRHFIKPKQADRSLLRLISTQPARTLPEVALQAAPGQELTCWSTLVAGSGSLQATMQRTRALPFRYMAWQDFGINGCERLAPGTPGWGVGGSAGSGCGWGMMLGSC